MKADDVIKMLNLKPHPEGGYFIEIKKSDEFFPAKSLPERYKGERAFYTSIYYMLVGENKSHFHKVNSDETWYFHTGSSVTIHMLSETNGYSKVILGNNVLENEHLQFTVPQGVWFSAELNDKNSFGLFSCNVAPGFEYADFELGKREHLIKLFPDYEKVINELTIKEKNND
jgi:uncharacterized protein